MERRGFLKLLAGAIAAVSVPAARALPSPPIPPSIESVAAGAGIESSPVLSLIRSISFSGFADIQQVTMEYLGQSVVLPRSIRIEIDVELLVEFGDCPRAGDLVDAQWFKDHRIARMFLDSQFLNDWPDDLRFMVTESQVMSEFPTGPVIAYLKMVAAR